MAISHPDPPPQNLVRYLLIDLMASPSIAMKMYPRHDVLIRRFMLSSLGK